MKKALIVVMMFAAISGVASAEEVRNRMEFPAKNGHVVFYHMNHVNEVQGNCKVCHEGAPGKIEGFGKDYAHTKCIHCHDGHDDMAAGPTECKGCHIEY